MKAVIALTLCATLTSTTAAFAKQAAPEHLYGPQPSWDEFRRIGEAAIAARLIDPESARVTWLSGIHKGGVKPILGGWVLGYVACGSVNARNRMGGYAGASVFEVVVDYGRPLYVGLDPSSGSLHADACSKAIGTGLFPPPPADAAPVARGSPAAVAGTDPEPLANAATGLALRAMPDGAYVSAVVPGSPAASAGLAPGMVVASVNAVPLAGLGDAMIKVVSAAGAHATLTLVGGRTVKLEGAK